jgi:hypothetical protein
MDSLLRLWYLANRYAGAIFIAAAVVLMLPENLALGLAPLTTEYRGYLSFALLVSGALVAATVLQQLWPTLRKRVVAPAAKLAFPVEDAKAGVKQSRMRYYVVRLSWQDGKHLSVYMELDSNGKKVRYADRHGKTYVPAQHYEESILHDGAFQFPSWGRLDWNDVLGGSRESGCWGIKWRR